VSILFGLQRNDEARVDHEQLLALSSATQRYAPDGAFVKGGLRIGMGYQPNYTHQRSKL
jgi:asparagine synthase (glutamine-hydrolysing)